MSTRSSNRVLLSNVDGQKCAFVLLRDGKVYKYWFKKKAVADPTTGTYKPIRWEP